MTQNATAQARRIDEAYGPQQNTLHGHTLTMLGDVLIPTKRDARPRADLTATRPLVEQHLRRAQQIHHAMMM